MQSQFKWSKIAMCLVAILLLSAATFPQQMGDLGNKKGISLSLNERPLFEVFWRLINEYDVAIGFEESTLDSEHNDYIFATNIEYDEYATNQNRKDTKISASRPLVQEHLITVNVKDASLNEVMDTIVSQMQFYKWRLRDDVINIYPIKGRNPKFMQLLRLKVSHFYIPRDSEVQDIRDAIFRLPEFKEFTDIHKVKVDNSRSDAWFLFRPLPQEIGISDTSFLDLLNGIVKEKRGGWILKGGRTGRISDSNADEEIDILI